MREYPWPCGPPEEIKKYPCCRLWGQSANCSDKPALCQGAFVKTQPSPLGLIFTHICGWTRGVSDQDERRFSRWQ